MSQKAIVLWVIRILTVLVCLFLMWKSELESSIEKEAQTFPYQITEVYCSSGGKSSSYLKIADKGKTYEVSVSGYQHCSSFKKGEVVHLYYNDLLDYYFLKGNKPVGIIICMILFGLTFLWEIYDRHKNKEQYK